MTDPYRTSPEVVERIVEKVVHKIPKCQYARCPSCEYNMQDIHRLFGQARKNQETMINAGAHTNAASFAREAELLMQTYTTLSLRKCEH